MGKAIAITEANFQQEVVNSAQPVMIDFWAEWCGPCRMVAPIVEELAGDYAGWVKVGKVDVQLQTQGSNGSWNTAGSQTVSIAE